MVQTTVPVRELLLNAGVEAAGPDPADLGLDGLTLVPQVCGGDRGVGREHGAVTGLTALG